MKLFIFSWVDTLIGSKAKETRVWKAAWMETDAAKQEEMGQAEGM